MWFTCSAVMKLGVAHQTCSKYRVCMMWYTPLLSSKWTAELGGLGLLNANKNANNISHQFLSSWEYTKRTVLVATGEISNSINLLLACSLRPKVMILIAFEQNHGHCCLCIGCGTREIKQTGVPCGEIKPSLMVVLAREALCCRVLYRFVCKGFKS